jgi:PKD repeat protein/Zn-dependent protease
MRKNFRLFPVILFMACVFLPVCGSAAPPVDTGSGFIVVASAPAADFYTSTPSGTIPLRVSFFDRSEGTLPLSYLWDFGDGSTSRDQNPTHAYGAPGRYTVSLRVKNAFGEDTKVLPGFIAVGYPPVPDFSVSVPKGNVPLVVSFTDRTNGAPDSWNWDFGDGSTSREQNPTHAYTQAGIFSITLSSGNEFGTGQITKTGIINTGVAPETEFAAETRQGDPPLTVRFRDFSAGNPVTWAWDFGDGSTSTEKDPQHTYTKEGWYTTRLRVTNAFGSDSLTRTDHIRVGNPTHPKITPAQPEIIVPLPRTSQPEGIAGLIRTAKGTNEKNLPATGLIPPRFMALAAVLTSFAVILLNLLISNIGTLTQVAPRIARFFADLAGGHAVEKISEAEIERRGITVRQRERHFLGLSALEIIVIEAAVIMVALAFILADRAELTLQNVLIYIIVGVISVVIHDFSHRWFATRHGHDADTQFWWLGTGIMFLTAWLYGNAFAQSYRNLVKRQGKEDAREMGIEMVAGPCMSIILMVLFLALIPAGGIWAVVGGVGFSINLITAVYSLMPIGTMDGGAIWKWNRGVYLGLFIPMVIFYFYTYIIV